MSALPLLLISVSGCVATPEPITVYETREVVVDRYIAVPDRMTAPVDVPQLSSEFDVFELGAVAKAREIRLLQCNGQLSEIAGLGD